MFERTLGESIVASSCEEVAARYTGGDSPQVLQRVS